MKKIVILLVVLCATLSTASAQFIKGGLKGGININSSNFEFNSNFIDGVKNNAGYHVGAFIRLPLGPIYLQGDALYVRNSYEYNISEGGSMKIKENRIDLPVVAGLNILFIRAYAGPRFDINLGTNVSKSISDGNSISADFDNRWLGYQVGLGVDFFKRISLDLSYNGYFKAPKQIFDIGGMSYNSRMKSRQFWLTIGYYFGGDRVKTNR